MAQGAFGLAIDYELLLANADELRKQRLIEMATAVCNEAKNNCGKDTLQLKPSIHVVEPGQTDHSWMVTDKDGNTFDNATGLTADNDEALVVARTQRHSDGHDYSWYHEEEGLGPSFYMRRAANAVRGLYEGIEVEDPRPI